MDRHERLAKLQRLAYLRRFDWARHARPDQRPPDNDGWLVWLILAGRGWGKTRTGAEWIKQQALAHPGSRWAVVAPTYADARDTCIEGESGILAVLPEDRVDTWNRSLGELVLANGSRVKLFAAEQPDRLRGPQHHGAWCVAAEVPVLTARGDVPIADVRPGDLVATRRGWKRVLAAQRTRQAAAVVTVRTASGREVRCTPDHPILADNAWRDAGTLTHGATLSACSTTDHPPTGTGTASAGTTTTAPAATAAPPASPSHKPSGPTSTAPSPTATTSTTSTATRPTTTPRTSPSSTAASTATATPPRTAASRPAPLPAPSRCGLLAPPTPGSASTAAPPTSPDPRTARTAGPTAAPALDAVASVRPSGWADVYDLTVEDAHEFYAGGVLVHNCDELAAWRYPEAWDQLQFGLRLGDVPRTVVTTTPRPTTLVRDLAGRPDVHVTRGATFDNADNLSAAALAELRNRYEGTRLGRQELYGELLDDVPGALWTAATIDAARVPTLPDSGVARVVTAIDPAVTSSEDSDLTGIVTAAVSDHGWCPICGPLDGGVRHGFVVADDSTRATPDGWCRTAVAAYDRWSGDRIVGEVNNGGDLIETVLRTVDPSVPFRKVTATRGKRVRAEPVAALYEQGRIHHVGALVDLEDQLCSWTPEAPGSPDRMDALVWAITDLLVDDAGRGRRRVVRSGAAA